MQKANTFEEFHSNMPVDTFWTLEDFQETQKFYDI